MKNNFYNSHPNTKQLYSYSNRSLDLDKNQIEDISIHLQSCQNCQLLCPNFQTIQREDLIIAIFGYIPPSEVLPGRLEQAKRTKLIWIRDDPEDALCSICKALYSEECECAYKAALKVMQTRDASYLLQEGYEMCEINKLLEGSVTPESFLKIKEFYPNSDSELETAI
jgi:hypothetical protein